LWAGCPACSCRLVYWYKRSDSFSLILFLFLFPFLLTVYSKSDSLALQFFIQVSFPVHKDVNHTIQQQCQLPHLRPTLTRSTMAVLLLPPSLRFSGFPTRLGADRGVVAAASDATRKSSYQLQQYADSPPRDDPYSPGHRDNQGNGARLAELDVALSSLQKGGRASSL
jgi:hypothetical protein